MGPNAANETMDLVRGCVIQLTDLLQSLDQHSHEHQCQEGDMISLVLRVHTPPPYSS